ncbi:cytochrome b/b6 domain-containing protein [Erwinia sp. MMLR14_017]|uniref:cytochrome b/b6 domain-containing protein n=1 Tax=Erwinia sp. MMLR14_017 TaxID=3093842 RepID=UPI00298F8479|nr:cytochrome b/b6 domain-containing protein [Erwinia sp. MMLR14_017]MDW8845095.1 cytochrome b/b6 domain-containing protein [Erwinia sp. MMLR14_017]
MSASAKKRVHPWPVRLCHWLNVLVMAGMVMSGWGIYNASPLFSFTFPQFLTLGGWLGGNLAWHLAVMWLLFVNALLYIVWGVLSGHFRRRFFPFSAGTVIRDTALALRFRLPHQHNDYNAVQKLLYVVVLLLGALLVLSGLAIWKPVQLDALVALFGGFDIARYVHFFAMSGLMLFVVLHVAMVLLVPKTLPAMVTGGKIREPADE